MASSTVPPPTAPPAPCMRLDLPYAVALRELFDEYKMRAQMNTKYMESSTREATVTHTLNLLISQLTRAESNLLSLLMKVEMYLGIFII